jgi:hypothetical protein
MLNEEQELIANGERIILIPVKHCSLIGMRYELESNFRLHEEQKYDNWFVSRPEDVTVRNQNAYIFPVVVVVLTKDKQLKQIKGYENLCKIAHILHFDRCNFVDLGCLDFFNKPDEFFEELFVLRELFGVDNVYDKELKNLAYFQLNETLVEFILSDLVVVNYVPKEQDPMRDIPQFYCEDSFEVLDYFKKRD